MPKEQLSFFQDIEKEKKKIILSLDKLYIIGVIILIGFVACFGLGVEKGRRLKLAGLDTQPLDDQDITQNASQIESIVPQREVSTVPGQKIIRDVPQKQNAPKIIERAQTDQAAAPGLYYSIQVASYKSPATAKAEAGDLKKKGFSPVIVRPGTEWTALCVGKFTTIEDAKKLAKSLKDRYSDCFVRKL